MFCLIYSIRAVCSSSLACTQDYQLFLFSYRLFRQVGMPFELPIFNMMDVLIVVSLCVIREYELIS